jgi:hypothetical protein
MGYVFLAMGQKPNQHPWGMSWASKKPRGLLFSAPTKIMLDRPEK